MENRRLISLDAFRGYTVAAMILVNFPGNWDHVFGQLQHTEWFGLTFTDLIAPFFLFIVGVSIAIAYGKRLEKGEAPRSFYPKILFRGLKIFAVGMFLNILGILDNFSFAELRWTGTLHRIAIVFIFCAVLFVNTGWKKQAMVAALLLLGYWLVMVLVPTPGYGKPMLEPGVNLAAWIDSKLLPGKMWQGTWDPEGIMSTFPAFATGISGMLAGTWIMGKYDWERKVTGLFAAGFIALAAGVVWSWVFPLNENLWTSSFVMVTSGLASMVLGLSIWVTDILGKSKGAWPGVVFGSNAITAYVLADILAIIFYGINFGGAALNDHFFSMATSAGIAPKLASMIYAILFVTVNFVPVYLLYRKKIFIKL